MHIKDYLSSYVDKKGSVIVMMNAATCKPLKINLVQINMYDGVICTLMDVRYISGLRKFPI